MNSYTQPSQPDRRSSSSNFALHQTQTNGLPLTTRMATRSADPLCRQAHQEFISAKLKVELLSSQAKGLVSAMERMSDVLAFPEQPSARVPCAAMTKPEARQVYQRLQEAFDQGAAQQSSLNAKLRTARVQASIKERELREAESRA